MVSGQQGVRKPPRHPRALQQRPQTWALTPPSARDFVIWCAACDPVIGAALAGACEGEEEVLAR